MVFTLNAGMYDFLVLSILRQQEAYGYQISKTIKKVSNMKDSALYPVLHRLLEKELVTAYDQQFQGRNRKYYKITAKGLAQWELLKEEWELYTEEIEKIVNGGNES